LTKFSACKVFISVNQYVIRKTQINVDSAQAQHLSDVIDADVLQSLSSLKTRNVVDDVQDKIIVNIHDDDDD
jgi:hypothetical protein